MVTPKLVKVSKEVFKDIFNSGEKSIKIPATEAKPLALTDAEHPTTEAKPLPPIRKRIVKKSVDPSFTEKEECLDCSY